MTKLFAATALAGLLAAAPAFAQDATPAQTTPATTPAATGDTMQPASPTVGRFVASPAADDWVASRLIGSTIYSPANESLGDVNDIVATKDGQVKAIVIGVGGFLGIGEKNVAVAPGELERVADGNSWRYQLNTTKEELNTAAEFKIPDEPAVDATATGTVDPNAPVVDPATPMAPAAPTAPATTTP